MRILSQNQNTFLLTDPVHNFDDNIECSTLDNQTAIMDVLKSILNDSPYPAFISETASGTLHFVNRAALAIVPSLAQAQSSIHNYISITAFEQAPALCNFGSHWFQYKQTPLSDNDRDFVITELKEREDVPGSKALESWNNMIEVMLHRFRSPLTGISGYLDMLDEDISTEDHQRLFNHINIGIHRLYNMMDELEQLYHIPSDNSNTEAVTQNILPVIQQSIMDLPADIRSRVVFEQPNEPVQFHFNHDNLKRILGRLLQNAGAHSENTTDDIIISIVPEKFIAVKNSGKMASIKVANHIFDPFVTTKSDGLGIGLTMALLHAQQFGGTLKLLEHKPKNELSFLVLFPSK
jgi:signal transduction histidine kinase